MRFIFTSLLLSAGVALAIPSAPLPTGHCEISSKCPGNKSIIYGAPPPSHKEYCNPKTHQCEPTIKNGERCSSKIVCESQICLDGVCKADFVGKHCNTTTDCKPSGFRYIFSPKTKTCLRSDLMKGSSCVESEQCVTGYCSPGGVCDHQPGGEFAECSSNAECSGGLVCRKARFIDKKTCQPDNGDLYAPCSSEKKCGTGLMCQNGECVQKPQCTEQGLTCTSNSRCCSKKCESTKIPLLYTCAPSQ